MYPKVTGQAIKFDDNSKFTVLNENKTMIGPEVWLRQILVEWQYKHKGKWAGCYYVMVYEFYGDNSDTMLSSSMNIDLCTSNKDKAIEMYNNWLPKKSTESLNYSDLK